MTDYERFLQTQDLYERASKEREKGNFEAAWKLEADAEKLNE